jgi:hypothetical protein
MIDKTFRDYDLDFVPVPVRYIIVLMFFIGPIIHASYMLCCRKPKAQVSESIAGKEASET